MEYRKFDNLTRHALVQVESGVTKQPGKDVIILDELSIQECWLLNFSEDLRIFFCSIDVTNFYPLGRRKVDENFQDTSVW